ncbi:MAG: cupin domain-containing protein [Elusimicrobiota bacterium]|jgi:mannose-6-phosphate isomerase-like protein (cupin superfamily)
MKTRRKQVYNIDLDVKFRPLQRIDLPAIVKQCGLRWFNQTLTRVNDSVVRIGIVQGEFHWHQHARDDEFFYVVSGKLLIDIPGRTITLGPKQGVTIPKGVRHRPRAPKKTVMLMVETKAIQPTGSGPG